jgi:hypothetical protein
MLPQRPLPALFCPLNSLLCKLLVELLIRCYLCWPSNFGTLPPSLDEKNLGCTPFAMLRGCSPPAERYNSKPLAEAADSNIACCSLVDQAGNFVTLWGDSVMADQQPTFWQVIVSVLTAFFGVQSDENRERDFKHGRPIYFIIAGLLLTLVFILVVWGTVKLALHAAGV